ncbi:MAG: HEPN domain-containing protein [Nanoarchaeota archaeon]
MRDEIKNDLERAETAFKSAERNFSENDIFTAANRAFVACENSIYVLLKLTYGSSSVSRIKILTRLKEVDKKAKETYDEAYDLRVQSDYGRESKILPLNQKNNVPPHLKRCGLIGTCFLDAQGTTPP